MRLWWKVWLAVGQRREAGCGHVIGTRPYQWHPSRCVREPVLAALAHTDWPAAAAGWNLSHTRILIVAKSACIRCHSSLMKPAPSPFSPPSPQHFCDHSAPSQSKAVSRRLTGRWLDGPRWRMAGRPEFTFTNHKLGPNAAHTHI